jgi:predicted Zn-dependent protease with MMP-like domain
VREGVDPRLLGLFSGVPLPDKTAVGPPAPVLDAIHLFQHNLERACRDREQLRAEIRITVLHETAHFFGLDDEDLEKLGLG